MSKHIHIHIHGKTKDAGEFKESDHPRGKGGMFTAGSAEAVSHHSTQQAYHLDQHKKTPEVKPAQGAFAQPSPHQHAARLHGEAKEAHEIAKVQKTGPNAQHYANQAMDWTQSANSVSAKLKPAGLIDKQTSSLIDAHIEGMKEDGDHQAASVLQSAMAKANAGKPLNTDEHQMLGDLLSSYEKQEESPKSKQSFANMRAALKRESTATPAAKPQAKPSTMTTTASAPFVEAFIKENGTTAAMTAKLKTKSDEHLTKALALIDKSGDKGPGSKLVKDLIQAEMKSRT